jgi:hypothetical protein
LIYAISAARELHSLENEKHGLSIPYQKTEMRKMQTAYWAKVDPVANRLQYLFLCHPRIILAKYKNSI